MARGFVDARGRAMQEGRRVRAVRHEQAGGFGVGAEVDIPPTRLHHREVHHQVDVVRHDREIRVGEIDGYAMDAIGLDRLALRGIPNSRQAVDVVVDRQGPGDR